MTHSSVRRVGDVYVLTAEEIEAFHSDGYVHLKVLGMWMAGLGGQSQKSWGTTDAVFDLDRS